MLFTSVAFLIFLPVVFCLYWFVLNRSLGLQNLFVTAASYLFYGWWDWRFLSLILFSTLVDYSVGLMLRRQEDDGKRKALLFISVFVNVGLLGFFKYYNFFLDSFQTAFSSVGVELSSNTLNIVLPVGISFYTFQTLSYTIDVFKKKLEPTKDLLAFAAFVSFFPQLVAGPIERAVNLLPQFTSRRVFDYDQAVDGLRQILWGFLKKIVIADQCSIFADMIFDNSDTYSGSTLVLGAVFFAFQIYGDFSGYSDIAIGTARLFGFNLMKNFAFPYFSRDIAEFWRRWHISLSTWFRDYLYFPLGGSRGGSWKTVRNVFVIFVVSGFWHGANWTFIIWGALNAIYFLPLILMKRNRLNLGYIAQGRRIPLMSEIFGIGSTFALTVLAWVFFRAETVGHALGYLAEIFSSSLLSVPEVMPKRLFLALIAFVAIEWIGRHQEYAIEKIFHGFPRPLRWGFYYLLLIVICFNCENQQQFIYFQF